MRTFFYCIILLPVVLFSCQDSVEKRTSINGIWESIGSGWLLEIKDSTTYAFFDVNTISCIPSRKGELKELEGNLSMAGDTLSLVKGVITYYFTRKDILPPRCTESDSPNIKDPLYNFEVFAETVKEHYPFMELNKIKWDSLYHTQKQKLVTKPTDVKLYKVLDETLELLNDNHAFLEASEELYQKLDLEEGEEEEETSTVKEYGDFEIAGIVAQHHLQEELTKDSWLMNWGILQDGIGYIQVKSMWLYADLDIPKALIEDIGYVAAYVQTFHQMYEGDYIDKEKEGVRKLMNTIMQDLSEMKSIVIDVRFNGGGQDAVSFEILSHFLSERTQIAKQKLRYGNQFSPTQALYVDPKTQPFNGPVYVLTSSQTGSAAEAFSIATMSINNIKRIGSATSGAMSTALEKKLPNGWSYAISNEVYMDNKGIFYENLGIPADYKLNYSRDRQTFFRSIADDLSKDKLDILKAIEELQRQ